MVFSTFGRARPEAQAALTALAVQAARRRGLRDHRLILRRVLAAIGVPLTRRCARMVWHCLPRLGCEEVQWLLGSHSGGGCGLLSPGHYKPLDLAEWVPIIKALGPPQVRGLQAATRQMSIDLGNSERPYFLPIFYNDKGHDTRTLADTFPFDQP